MGVALTLRVRLTLLTFSLLLLSLLAFAGVAGALLWRVERSSIARQVTAQADALLTVALATAGPLPDSAGDMLEENGETGVARVYAGAALRWTGGASGPDVLDAAFLHGREVETTRQVGEYLVASNRRGGVSVQVGRNLRPLRNLLERYTLIAALTLLGLSAMAGALVARQVRRTLHPLEALAGRMQRLDSPEPLPALHEPGEVGALARALDASLRALQAERDYETLFLASASHELRTPVTAMLADVQHTLGRDRPPGELRAALERTERTASRLRLLTGNLMTLARVPRLADPHPQWPELNLLNLTGEVIDLLQPLAMQRDLDLWLDGQDARVNGESGLLRALVENLIGNAIKFTPVGGHIQVNVTAAGPQVQLTVDDSGPGFPDGALTGAFVRGQTAVEGFGLGLAVAQQVVDAHGGTLHLTRAPGGGARVVVALPAAGAPRPP